ncbi:MAG: hypothetical protein M2R45_04135 [Verrucomicrobia subdivision 3 bacterium]|nr:hypothetical protein [Limisphaerales bacterium]MCS1417677.1 hypothetical protein [Limisphaerales bacterium]
MKDMALDLAIIINEVSGAGAISDGATYLGGGKGDAIRFFSLNSVWAFGVSRRSSSCRVRSSS